MEIKILKLIIWDKTAKRKEEIRLRGEKASNKESWSGNIIDTWSQNLVNAPIESIILSWVKRKSIQTEAKNIEVEAILHRLHRIGPKPTETKALDPQNLWLYQLN